MSQPKGGWFVDLENARYEVLDVDRETLRERKIGRIRHPGSKKLFAIRLGNRRLQDSARALMRAARHTAGLPVVIATGSAPELGHYVVTKWVGEESLNRFIASAVPQTFEETSRAYFAALSLVRALHRIHDIAGVVHADVSAANVVRCKDGSLALIDFGFAFRVERTMTREKDEGTPGYAAPELSAKPPVPIDFRADQFAASALIFEILTGDLPYEGVGGGVKDPSAQPGSAGRKNPYVWASLDRVLVRGLSLDREQRFPTSRQWLEAFSAATPERSLLSRARAFIKKYKHD